MHTYIRVLSHFACCSALLISGFYQPPFAYAGESDKSAGGLTDEKLIREQASEFIKACENGDAEKVAQCWAENAVLIDQSGHVYKGRSEIQAAYQDFFRSRRKIRLAISIDSITFPSDSVAIETGVTRQFDGAMQVDACRYMSVHTKNAGQWLLDNVIETGYEPEATAEYIQPLSWLIGSWTAKSEEQSKAIRFSWGKNRNFIVVSSLDADTKSDQPSETQVIGWNPLLKRISSWYFAADGGYGIGDWRSTTKGWLITARCVQPDGGISKATYILAKDSDKAFSWKSINRIFNGALLPDTKAIKVVRDDQQ